MINVHVHVIHVWTCIKDIAHFYIKANHFISIKCVAAYTRTSPNLSVPARRRPGMSRVASFLGFLNCQVYRASLEAHIMWVLVMVRYTGSISTYLESRGVPMELQRTNTNCKDIFKSKKKIFSSCLLFECSCTFTEVFCQLNNNETYSFIFNFLFRVKIKISLFN